MLTSRQSLAIALIFFYTPLLVLLVYLFVARHKHERLPWALLCLFSAIRIASGGILVAYESDPYSVGLAVASAILLAIGIVPLLRSTLALLQRILTDYEDASGRNKLYKTVLDATFLLGLVLFIVGGALGSHADSESPPPPSNPGRSMTKAGNVVIAISLVLCALLHHLWLQLKRHLKLGDRLMFRCLSLALPFLSVRIAYGLASVFAPNPAMWGEMSASLGLLIGMDLVMEYIVVCLYTTAGILMKPRSPDRQKTLSHSGTGHMLLNRRRENFGAVFGAA